MRQKKKKGNKIFISMKCMEKGIKKVVAPRIWSYDQKINFYSLPLEVIDNLEKTSRSCD